MPKTTDPNPPNRNAPAGLFGVFLFAAMVGAVCTVAVLVLTEEWTLIGAVGLGALLSTVVGIVLLLLLRNPLPPLQESRDAFEPLSSFRKGEVPDEGQRMGGQADRRPTTTQDTLAVGGATGGLTDVAVAPTPEARSPGEPAERPVPGAGAPGRGVAADIVDAARNGNGGGGGDGAPDADANGSRTAPPPPGAGADRHAGGGDPGGVDAEMPDADAPRAGSAEAAAGAFGAQDGPGAEQVEPQRLDAPRDGGPDDFKRIRGVGPKLEEMLHGMGIYHFDQIAEWGPGEVAWADEHLEGFRGRVTRDDWVGQARALRAGGGEAEFASPRITEG